MNIRDLAFLAERDRRMEERFQAQEKAVELALAGLRREKDKDYTEFQRRLEALNHAHQQAREKERDFISREVYEKQVERATDELRTLAVEVKTAAAPVASALVDQEKRNNDRFVKLESVQGKMVGALILASVGVPLLSALLVYFIGR